MSRLVIEMLEDWAFSGYKKGDKVLETYGVAITLIEAHRAKKIKDFMWSEIKNAPKNKIKKEKKMLKKMKNKLVKEDIVKNKKFNMKEYQRQYRQKKRIKSETESQGKN
jgi:hypothetical protein